MRNRPSSWKVVVLSSFLLASLLRAETRGEGWSAGAAKTDITPKGSVWLAGYAARKEPSKGVALPIHAKALALRDGDGKTFVLVTADLIGFDRDLTREVVARLETSRGLSRDAIAFTASHTHTGPLVKHVDATLAAYGIDPKAAENNVAFRKDLREKLVAVVESALAIVKPARVEYGVGRAEFAINRREKTATGYRIGLNPDGPTDKDVPVLKVTDVEGKPIALTFGYACHNTTLTDKILEISGDYAGFAQAELEKRHPGAVALFVTGCGADANPNPRGTVELGKAHGLALADAVEKTLSGSLATVSGSIRSAFSEPDLKFAGPTDKASYERRLGEPGAGRQAHAKRMISEIEKGKPIRSKYPYPVHVAALGDRLTFVALGGEVVVDYARRLKREIGGEGRDVWVAGYTDDVFGYIPSVRVLKEGGYEGGESFYYSTFPTPFDESVESIVVDATRSLVRKVRGR